MRLLLDTHILLWWLEDSHKLPKPASEMIGNPVHEVYFSAASIWEISIKRSLNLTGFVAEPEEVAKFAEEERMVELPVTAAHAARVRHLPHLHRDPFDRILIAQALSEPLILLTSDTQVAAYGQGIVSV